MLIYGKTDPLKTWADPLNIQNAFTQEISFAKIWSLGLVHHIWRIDYGHDLLEILN